jgi:inosine-uridine nucleoside N-ribohydrolase
MPRKLIIDADPGIGDAFAIALAALDPSIDLIGVTAVPGCVTGHLATQNILAIIESVDPPKLPRVGAASGPRPNFGSPVSFLDPLRLNGNYGMGTTELQFMEMHNQRDSVKVLIDLVRNNPDEVTLLTLGPLTNVSVALDLAPDFGELLQSLVCLCGSIGVGGDATAAAEFNVFANPIAAVNVFKSNATRTLVPLDVSNNVMLSFDQFNRMSELAPRNLSWFFESLLPFSLRVHHEELGWEGLPIREVTALAYIAEPRHFETEPMYVDVELQADLTRGTTVFDRRGTIPRSQRNIEVVKSVDAQGVLDYVTRVLKASASETN